MSGSERVSVVIPVYNCEEFILYSIESVSAQTRAPDEIIVVDDGSSDKTAELCRSVADVRLIQQEHKGVATARNLGLEKASHEWIAWQDADDIWLPEKLEMQFELLKERPELRCVFTNISNFSDEAEPWMESKEFNKEYLGIPTMLIHRDVFNQIGVFNTELEFGEDTDFFFRLKDAGIPFATIPDVLLKRRVHRKSLTFRNTRDRSEVMLKLIAQSIERKRKK